MPSVQNHLKTTQWVSEFFPLPQVEVEVPTCAQYTAGKPKLTKVTEDPGRTPGWGGGVCPSGWDGCARREGRARKSRERCPPAPSRVSPESRRGQGTRPGPPSREGSLATSAGQNKTLPRGHRQQGRGARADRESPRVAGHSIANPSAAPPPPPAPGRGSRGMGIPRHRRGVRRRVERSGEACPLV